MTLILSLILTADERLLLGSTSQGEVYVWLFHEILIEKLKEKIEKETIFSSICKFVLKEGNIQNLFLVENDMDSLFYNDDTSLYCYSWTDLHAEIQERKNQEHLSANVTKFLNTPKLKYNINQDNNQELERIQSIDYDRVGKRSYIGTDKGNVLIIDLRDFKLLKKVTPVKHMIALEDNLISISAIRHYKENIFAFGNGKGNLELWDADAGKSIKTFKLEKDPLSSIHYIEFEKDLKWIIAGHNDYITRWHVQSATLDNAMPVTTELTSIFSADSFIYSSHNDNQILQWNQTGELMSKIEASSSSVTCLTGKVEEKDRILIAAGAGPLVDVFLNSYRVLSFVC